MSQQNPIHEHHRQRLAYIYIRQSTLRQVAEHQESQDLQYQLADRAQALGWLAERIHIIDEDLGKSAVSSSERSGFQRLFTDVGTGKVGILLVTDVSRLANDQTKTHRFPTHTLRLSQQRPFPTHTKKKTFTQLPFVGKARKIV